MACLNLYRVTWLMNVWISVRVWKRKILHPNSQLTKNGCASWVTLHVNPRLCVCVCVCVWVSVYVSILCALHNSSSCAVSLSPLFIDTWEQLKRQTAREGENEDKEGEVGSRDTKRGWRSCKHHPVASASLMSWPRFGLFPSLRFVFSFFLLSTALSSSFFSI